MPIFSSLYMTFPWENSFSSCARDFWSKNVTHQILFIYFIYSPPFPLGHQVDDNAVSQYNQQSLIWALEPQFCAVEISNEGESASEH